MLDDHFGVIQLFFRVDYDVPEAKNLYYSVQLLTDSIGEKMELDRGVYGNSLNVAESHEKSFTIERLCSLPDFLFLHFLTGVHLQSTAGRRVKETGVAVLYAPSSLQWFTGVEAELTHDWIHLLGDDLGTAMRNPAILLNTMFHLVENDN